MTKESYEANVVNYGFILGEFEPYMGKVTACLTKNRLRRCIKNWMRGETLRLLNLKTLVLSGINTLCSV